MTRHPNPPVPASTPDNVPPAGEHPEGPRVGPPGQSPWAGRVIALVVFFGVVLTTIAIVLLPEQTADFEDTVRLYPDHTITVRLTGDRGMLEIMNQGPGVVMLRSPTESGPLTEPMELLPTTYVRRDVRDVGSIEVINVDEIVTTIRWRGGGPEPIFVTADPPREMGVAEE